MISEISKDWRSAGGVQEWYSSPQSLIGKDYLDHKVALLHNSVLSFEVKLSRHESGYRYLVTWLDDLWPRPHTSVTLSKRDVSLRFIDCTVTV